MIQTAFAQGIATSSFLGIGAPAILAPRPRPGIVAPPPSRPVAAASASGPAAPRTPPAVATFTLKYDNYEQFLHVHIIYESLKTFIYKYQTNWDLFVFKASLMI